MVKKIIIVFAVFCVAIACGKKDYKTFLNGKWTSELQDIEFDFNKNEMKSELKMFGLVEQKKSKIESLETVKDCLLLKTSATTSTITVVNDNNIRMQREGSPLALDLKRVSKK